MGEFENIRVWNGSKGNAWEELCCQLARHEYPATQGEFRRVRGAGGDAGVEGYWIFGDGSKHGWQAKYFFGIGASQWKQIDDSVQTAILKHPELSAYTICLPIDRTEGRKTRKGKTGTTREKSLVDRWNEHVQKWQEAAGTPVEFHYWGESEVLDRLSRTEHRGRRFFWFGETELSQPWFQDRLNEALATAGQRYTSETNVELPIASSLDAVGRTDAFYDRIAGHSVSIRTLMNRIGAAKCLDLEGTQLLSKVRSAHHNLEAALSRISPDSFDPIDFTSTGAFTKELRDHAEELEKRIDQIVSDRARGKARASPGARDPDTDALEAIRFHLYHLGSAAGSLVEFCESREAKASNTAALLVMGEAGQGKTHLFCDTAVSRQARGLGTAILFGEHFTDEEPWTQMIKLLHLSCSTAEEFLGALQSHAEARGRRSLILVDALNETDNRGFWRIHLPAIIQFLKKYPGVALAVSCRSSYERLVIPDQIVPERLVEVVHQGFSGHEEEATSIFFRNYGIEESSVPLLRPEFSNPLFLKLFCQSLQNEGLSRIPKGLRGITALFAFFSTAVHNKLARRMDYDPAVNYVEQALRALANYMGANTLAWVPRDEAKTLVNSLLPAQADYSKTLYANLLHEGVLVENAYRRDDSSFEGVRTSFEKFTDHLVVQNLLAKHLGPAQPRTSFRKGTVLGDLFLDQYKAWINQGWIEALSVQIPEKLGCELVDLIPRAKDWDVTQQAFLQSLVWREPSKTTSKTDNYLNTVFKRRHTEVYSTLLMLAADPEHGYNALSLHKHLMHLTMPVRDGLWSIFLHDHYGSDDSMDRLMKWAWHGEKSHICDESVELAGTALAWYFTTSHRFVRDRTTKALVSMLRSRPRLMGKLLDRFADVDDLYVAERLYAAAYGVAMTTYDDTGLAELASVVYRRVFESGRPVPHILLRDYARGVIEVALHRGVLDPTIDLGNVRPPYSSDWITIPEEAEIAHYGEWRKDATEGEIARSDGEIARNMIYGSVMGRIEGDFSHYVIGDHPRWSAERIDRGTGSNKTTTDRFFASLTERQKKAWETLRSVRQAVPRILALDPESHQKVLPVDDDVLSQLPQAAEEAFLRVLGKKKSAVYTQYVAPYVSDRPNGGFDLTLARRWILKRVFELGWTEERFGYFDRWRDYGFRYGRSGHKPERMGKKYQWIALHEFFAHVSDHFYLAGDYGDLTPRHYDNPGEVGLRDIDPSMLLDSLDEQDQRNDAVAWWHRPAYVFTDATTEEKERWTLDTDDTPPPSQLIEVIDPSTGSSWLSLYSNPAWTDRDPNDETLGSPRREMWFHVRCYLVRQEHSDLAFAALVDKNLWGHPLAESGDFYEVFLGEYPWASPCNKPEVRWDWFSDIDHASEPLPRPIAVTSMAYHGVSEYDCSTQESCSGLLPSALLCEAMGLRWSRNGFGFVDSSGRVVVFDASVLSERRSALLLDKAFCLSFLGQGDHDLIWTILGAREFFRSDGFAYNGVLSLSGAYRYENGILKGQMLEHFRSYSRVDGVTNEWDGRIIHELP